MTAGCRRQARPAAAATPGLVAQWGSRGRIDGAFVKPRVIDVLPDGTLAVIDRSGRVQRFDANGVFEGKFTLEKVGKGFPTGIDIGPDGNLWIAETHAYRVGVYTREGRRLFTFGSQGDGDGQFVYVSDVAISPQGRVYVSDYGGPDRVQEFDLDGNFVRELGGSGSEPGQFRRPLALCCTSDGTLFVADAVNHRIQKFSPDGALVGVYGSPGRDEGQLYYPYDLAASDEGIVYIAEFGNNRVQRMTFDGEFRGTWSGGSKPLVCPWGVAVDTGRLFVLDTGNSRVLHLDPGRVEWSSGMEG